MKARTVCCHKLVDTQTAPMAKNKWGEYLVCNSSCKSVMEMATQEQMDKLSQDKE